MYHLHLHKQLHKLLRLEASDFAKGQGMLVGDEALTAGCPGLQDPLTVAVRHQRWPLGPAQDIRHATEI